MEERKGEFLKEMFWEVFSDGFLVEGLVCLATKGRLFEKRSGDDQDVYTEMRNLRTTRWWFQRFCISYPYLGIHDPI